MHIVMRQDRDGRYWVLSPKTDTWWDFGKFETAMYFVCFLCAPW